MVHGANMGLIWGRQDPGGPHDGPMNFTIWDVLFVSRLSMVMVLLIIQLPILVRVASLAPGCCNIVTMPVKYADGDA